MAFFFPLLIIHGPWALVRASLLQTINKSVSLCKTFTSDLEGHQKYRSIITAPPYKDELDNFIAQIIHISTE